MAREELHRAGLYASRITVEDWPAASLPDYFASLIIADVAETSDDTRIAWNDLAHTLRPSGGEACQRQTDATWKHFTREPLDGADAWTHLYANEHNTGVSADEQLHGPLQVLWFGEPGEQGLIDRHGRGMGPLSMEGRLFVEGEESIRAYDAYNGTLLWYREIPGAFRVRVDVDAGNMAIGPEGLFIAVYDQCYRLDPATGKTLAVFDMPIETSGELWRWGYVALHNGLLLGSSSPALNDYALLWKAYVDEEKNKFPCFISSRSSRRNESLRLAFRKINVKAAVVTRPMMCGKGLKRKPGQKPQRGQFDGCIYVMDKRPDCEPIFAVKAQHIVEIMRDGFDGVNMDVMTASVPMFNMVDALGRKTAPWDFAKKR